MTFMSSRSRVFGLLTATTVVGAAAPASAQDEVLARVRDLNKKAVDAYENLDLDEARKYLMQALEACASEGLNNHPMKALTHVNLGVVFVGGLKQREQGIRQFRRALEIDPKVRVAKRLQNPEVMAAFEEAQKGAAAEPEVATDERPERPTSAPPQAAPAPDPAAAPAEGRPPARVKGIFHEPLVDGKAGEPLTVKAAVEPALGADRVVLAYKPEGASDFLARDMEVDDGGWHVARIPQVATTGASVSYYVEARDAAGKPVANNGSAAEPHVVSFGDARPDPGARVASGAADEPDGVRARERRGALANPFWVALAIGGGGGRTSGSPEVNPRNNGGQPIKFSGFAPAQLLHIAPEVGYALSQNLVLSLQGRFQVVTGATKVVGSKCGSEQEDGVCEPAKGAIAVLGKATWHFGPPGGLRPFVAFAAGGGQIRHLVNLENLTDCGDSGREQCVDTIASGSVLLGPAGGISYAVSDTLRLLASVNTLLALPDSALNFDVNLGVGASF